MLKSIDRVPYLAPQAATPYEGLRPVPVSILLHDVRSLYNVGAFFRSADAAGWDKLYLSGITARPPHAGIAKTALGVKEPAPGEHAPAPAALIQRLRRQGHEI